MEINNVTVVTKAQDYADLCAYIKQLESISLTRVFQTLKTYYLSFLILPIGEQCLPIFQKHLAEPYSWLAKAQCLLQAETKREFARQQVDIAAGSPEQMLWEDAAKKLNYLMDGWDKDVALTTQQIIQGIETLINDRIVLSEVQAEIIEFAQARGVSPASGEHAEKAYAVDRLAHALDDAKINSITNLSKMAKTTIVQAELFLNRLTAAGASLESLDTKQAFLFQVNRHICECIQKQANELRDSLNNFPTLLAAKMVRRLEKIDVDAVLERYNGFGKISSAPEEIKHIVEEKRKPVVDHVEEKNAVEEISVVDQIIEEAEHAVAEVIPDELIYEVADISVTELEKLLAAREQLLLTVMKQIALHRLQLSCFGRIKACYKKFHLFPVFNRISVGLSDCQKTLHGSLHEIKQVHKREIHDEWKKKFQLMIDTFETGLQRIDTYMNNLKTHHEQEHVKANVPLWQTKLYDLVMQSSEESLLAMDACLQRIASLDSPYLRTTLVMRLKLVQAKLNDMILLNMQSWSTRHVDKNTVNNTLNYLGVNLPPHHLIKIAPSVRLPAKKKVVKRQDFYANAADYGVNVYKNIREWLNERIMS